MNALIFSHQRCGSSNLLRFVGEAFQIPAVLEAFNIKSLGRKLPDWEKASQEVLTSHFEKVLSKARVVKHIYGQHEAAIDELIAATPSSSAIVFLYRQNAHASALSALIARKVQHFDKQATEPIGPIPARKIERLADEMLAKRHQAISQCLDSGRPVLSIPYENLFASSVDARKERAKTIIEFLERSTGMKSSQENFEAAFDKFLSEERKTNSLETYRLIENFDKLQSRFPNIFTA